MKKIISLILVSLLVISMCGCGKKQISSDNVVTWYMQKPIDNMTDMEIVMEEANKIIEKELGVKLEFHFFDSASFNDKMNVMIASGEEFDICMTNSWTNNFVNNVKRGAFIELTDLMEKYGQDIMAKTDPVVLETFKVDGGMYGIKSQSAYSTGTSRVFRKDLVEKYNFDYKNAKTLESIEPFLKQIKENEPGITPLLVGAKTNAKTEVNPRYTDDSIPGLRFDEETEKFEYVLSIPHFLNLYRTHYDYYKKGYIASDAAIITEITSEAKSGNYAIMPSAGAYTEDGSKSSGVYGFPCVETYLGQSVISSGVLFDAINAISVTSKKPEKAMQVLNLIWKDRDLSNMLAYGIENIHYYVDEERSAEIGDKSIVPKSGSEQTWAIWHNWLGPLWDQWDSNWNRKEALEEFQSLNKTAIPSKALGFVFNTEPVKSECAQVKAVFEEITPVLNTGSMPDFDEYIKLCEEKLKASGIEKIYEEANKQYKEWANK